MIITCIDPGKHGCGVACGNERELFWAGYHPTGDASWAHGDEVYLELPRYYPGNNKTDPNDLIDIAVAGAFLAGQRGFRSTLHLIPPRTWKGTIDGDAMVERIRGRLTPEETARVEMPSAVKTLGHNVLDAVGIFLWATGRLKPRHAPTPAP